MKRNSLPIRAVFAALLVSVSASVFAAVDRPAIAASPEATVAAAASGTQGKTRAQVRAELVQAEESGLVPAGNTRYPAGAGTIARNRYNFQSARTWWAAHGQQATWGG
ncbi:DUF4148 domain-containing protein [Paraburkholderia sp. 2C]|jgi:uncharacterized protein DUF4148